MTAPDRAGGIKTVGTTFDVVEALHRGGELGVTEVANAVGVANSTAHDHLASLVERGYVVRTGDGYRLSLRFLDLGGGARRRLPLDEAAQGPLKTVAERTGEVAWLEVEENGYAVHIRKAVGGRGIEAHGWVGRHPHMHHLAGGKAILAHLPDERIEAIVEERGLPEKTDATITDREALRAELERVRERGYAFNDEETYMGLRCIGAPIVPHGEGVVGAVAVCGPSHRFTEDQMEAEILGPLLECTNEIELKLSHD